MVSATEIGNTNPTAEPTNLDSIALLQESVPYEQNKTTKPGNKKLFHRPNLFSSGNSTLCVTSFAKHKIIS